MKKENLKQCMQSTPTAFMNYSTHWISADKQHEVFVLEDDPFWSSHTDVHKLAATTGSFSFVRDQDNKILDVSAIETLQNVQNS